MRTLIPVQSGKSVTELHMRLFALSYEIDNARAEINHLDVCLECQKNDTFEDEMDDAIAAHAAALLVQHLYRIQVDMLLGN